MNISEVLDRAADHIEANGWMSPAHCEGPDPTCAHVAIRRVSDDAHWEAVRALWTYLGGTFIDDVWHWNDAPGRTAAEVIETLRAAALIAAASEVEIAVVTPRELVS